MRDATEEDASGMPKWQQKLCRKMRKWDLKGTDAGSRVCNTLKSVVVGFVFRLPPAPREEEILQPEGR